MNLLTTTKEVPSGVSFSVAHWAISIDLADWGWSSWEWPTGWRDISTMGGPLRLCRQVGPVLVARESEYSRSLPKAKPQAHPVLRDKESD